MSKHGEFKIRPNCLFNGNYCPQCKSIATRNNKREKLDKIAEELKVKFKNLYGDLYDYSKFVYKNSTTKIIVICKEHGEFLCTIKSHLKGIGCIKCRKHKSDTHTKRKRKRNRVQPNHKKIICLEDRISLLSDIHKNKYDYSKLVYNGFSKNMTVICPEHGEFQISYGSHKSGAGCKKCANVYSYTTEEFISKYAHVHDFKYDYSQFVYKDSRTKSTIICPKHGAWQQSPKDHIQGYGCPRCCSSKGELAIRRFLIKNSIKFEPQYTFDDCKNINRLPFDFGILNEDESLFCLLEFHGEQHYRAVRFHKMSDEQMIKKFNDTVFRDAIKKEYCEKNQIKILYISYKQLDEIEEILSEYLKLNSN